MTPRARWRQSMARRRAQWRTAGRCLDCGRARNAATLRCTYCCLGNAMRQARWVFRHAQP